MSGKWREFCPPCPCCEVQGLPHDPECTWAEDDPRGSEAWDAMCRLLQGAWEDGWKRGREGGARLIRLGWSLFAAVALTATWAYSLVLYAETLWTALPVGLLFWGVSYEVSKGVR